MILLNKDVLLTFIAVVLQLIVSTLAQACSNQCKSGTFSMNSRSPDSPCTHIAHPVFATEDKLPVTTMEELKFEASTNLVVEDLHSNRTLETIFPVTGTTQTSTFYWDRETGGVRVHVGIQDVHLVPEYEDMDYESDNLYMLSNNPDNKADKPRFKDITRKYCRHPIPDYYSVSLELSRDRMTAAKEVPCARANNGGGGGGGGEQCPPEHEGKDHYIFRSVNEPCQKMGTFPLTLKSASNTIVCTEYNRLLTDIFNLTYASQHNIRITSKQCKAAQSRCDQCLNQMRCNVPDVFEQKCCQIDCYTLPDCKLAHSTECTSAPVDCAMGDAYSYTIQPEYPNLAHQMTCHIRRRPPTVLYQLFYYFQVIKTDFVSPRQYRTVYADDLRFQSSGSIVSDYLTVTHNAGLDLKDDFILIGREPKGSATNSAGDDIDFTVYPLKTPEQMMRRGGGRGGAGGVAAHEMQNNAYLVLTQFERPFTYSTSNWVTSGGCQKNTSKFLRPQPHHTPEGQAVHVAIGTVSEPFRYQLKAASGSPVVHFSIPGNVSVLASHFTKHGPVLLTNDSSLYSELLLNVTAFGYLWDIRISGQLSDCPGYLSVTINDNTDKEELFLHDVFVMCPPRFSLAYKVPSKVKVNKTFTAILHDGKHTHHIHLTSFVRTASGAVVGAGSDVDGQPRENKMASEWLAPPTHHSSNSLSIVFVGVVVVCGGSLIVYLLLFALSSLARKTKAGSCEMDGLNESIVLLKQSEAVAGSGERPRCTPCLVLYVFLKVTVSICLTFTAVYIVTQSVNRQQITQLQTTATGWTSKWRNASASVSAQIVGQANNELQRQSETLAGMQRACSAYTSSVLDELVIRFSNGSFAEVDGDTLSKVVVRRFHRVFDGYEERVHNYTRNYQQSVRDRVHLYLMRYKRYLERVYQNGWFVFAQKLFNTTVATNAAAADAGASGGSSRGCSGNQKQACDKQKMMEEPFGVESDFNIFIDVEEVAEVVAWKQQLFDRLLQAMPRRPRIESLIQASLGASSCSSNIRAGGGGTEDSEEAGGLVVDRSQQSRVGYLISPASLPSPESVRVQQPSGSKGRSASCPRVTDTTAGYRLLQTSSDATADAAEAGGGKSRDSPLDLSAAFDVAQMRFIFLLLDALLIFHRLCRAYSNCRALSSSSSSSTSSISAQRRAAAVLNHHDPPADVSIATTASHHSNGSHGEVVTSSQYDVTDAGERRSAAGGRLMQGLLVALSSESMPVIVFASMALLVLFALISAASVFDVHYLMNTRAWQAALQAPSYLTHFTTTLVNQQGAYFDGEVLSQHGVRATSDLLQLQATVASANTELDRLRRNLAEEAVMLGDPLWLSRTSGIGQEAGKVDISILPCVFTSVGSLLSSGAASPQVAMETALLHGLQPIISQLRTVVMRLGYSAMIVVVVVLLLHVVGSVLFHVLAVRCCHGDDTGNSGDVSDGGELRSNNGSSRRGRHGDEDKMAATPGSAATFPRRTDASRSHYHHQQQHLPHPAGSRTLQFVTIPTPNNDFKYSETKV